MKRLSVSNALIAIILGLCAIAAVFPFYQTLVLSMSTILDSKAGGVMLFPRSIDLSSYQYIFHEGKVVDGLLISVFVTVLGTLVNLVDNDDRRLRVIQEFDARPKHDPYLHHLYDVFFRRSYSLLFDDSKPALAE